jgi:hypothetical protein
VGVDLVNLAHRQAVEDSVIFQRIYDPLDKADDPERTALVLWQRASIYGELGTQGGRLN